MARPLRHLPHVALLGALLSCAPPGGDGLRGTTRLCTADGAFVPEQPCYRQCAALPASCKVTQRGGDGAGELVECARDPVTGAYLLDMTGALVPPMGATRCFALQQDRGTTPATIDDLPAACVDLESNLALVVAGELEPDVCWDLDCATAPADACADLAGSGTG
jgi:hypothetical protein